MSPEPILATHLRFHPQYRAGPSSDMALVALTRFGRTVQQQQEGQEDGAATPICLPAAQPQPQPQPQSPQDLKRPISCLTVAAAGTPVLRWRRGRGKGVGAAAVLLGICSSRPGVVVKVDGDLLAWVEEHLRGRECLLVGTGGGGKRLKREAAGGAMEDLIFRLRMSEDENEMVVLHLTHAPVCLPLFVLEKSVFSLMASL